MNLFRRALWLYGFLAILAGPLLAADLTGRVTAVGDGDTMTLLVPDGASYQQVTAFSSSLSSAMPSLFRNTCLIQDDLGRRNIQHTLHYTAAHPARFEKLWR
jgi:hypothetical protein